MDAAVTNGLIQILPDGIKRRMLTQIYSEMGMLDVQLKEPSTLTGEEWGVLLNNSMQLNAMLDIAMKLK